MTVAVTDLYGKDEDSTPGHHVEEEDHGFILMGGVSVKYPLGHDMTLRQTQQQTVTELSDLLDLSSDFELFLLDITSQSGILSLEEILEKH